MTLRSPLAEEPVPRDMEPRQKNRSSEERLSIILLEVFGPVSWASVGVKRRRAFHQGLLAIAPSLLLSAMLALLILLTHYH